VYRITSDGTIVLFGTGFEDTSDLAFGPDGALYVGDTPANAIYRITPADIMTVSIDIMPGSDKNPVNPHSKGTLSVAVLTTDDFDASTVDANSVRFGPSAAEPIKYRLDDVDDDGDMDLLLKFKDRDTGIECDDTEATLTGETFDEQSIAGTDSVKTVGCKSKTCENKKHHMNHHDDDCDDDKRHHWKHGDNKHHKT